MFLGLEKRLDVEWFGAARQISFVDCGTELLKLQFLFFKETKTRANDFARRTEAPFLDLPADEGVVLIAESDRGVFGHCEASNTNRWYQRALLLTRPGVVYSAAYLPFASAITRSI
ncbi:hypothetical protein MPLB_430034 [Mesorhizobium sp. ORS 3324]|nr:hypothetical protein MPLB_430034 [Mesorhizobium sp. ORS 3324]